MSYFFYTQAFDKFNRRHLVDGGVYAYLRGLNFKNNNELGKNDHFRIQNYFAP